jgi:hypothetical protein
VTSGSGAVNMPGGGTTIFSGSNSSGGTTTITGGTLKTENAHAVGTSAVVLNGGGTLEPVGQVGLKSLLWNGGVISMSLGTVSISLQISGALTNGGAGGAFEFTAGSGFALNTTYALATSGSDGFHPVGLRWQRPGWIGSLLCPQRNRAQCEIRASGPPEFHVAGKPGFRRLERRGELGGRHRAKRRTRRTTPFGRQWQRRCLSRSHGRSSLSSIKGGFVYACWES